MLSVVKKEQPLGSGGVLYTLLFWSPATCSLTDMSALSPLVSTFFAYSPAQQQRVRIHAGVSWVGPQHVSAATRVDTTWNFAYKALNNKETFIRTLVYISTARSHNYHCDFLTHS